MDLDCVVNIFFFAKGGRSILRCFTFFVSTQRYLAAIGQSVSEIVVENFSKKLGEQNIA
jgi:hypothetical protein